MLHLAVLVLYLLYGLAIVAEDPPWFNRMSALILLAVPADWLF